MDDRLDPDRSGRRVVIEATLGIEAALSDYPLELRLAITAIVTLWANDVDDVEIVEDYTRPCPQSDRAYERWYWQEHGEKVEARVVKAYMRSLLTH